MRNLFLITALTFAFSVGYFAPKESVKAATAQEARAIAGNFQLTDGDPSHIKVFHFSVIPSFGHNLIYVDVFNKDGVFLGSPIRFKMSNSGGRVAADLPSVSDGSFIIDGSGHITNG